MFYTMEKYPRVPELFLIRDLIRYSPNLQEICKKYWIKSQYDNKALGTHDVSLISIDDGVFEVKATAGDTHLG